MTRPVCASDSAAAGVSALPAGEWINRGHSAENFRERFIVGAKIVLFPAGLDSEDGEREGGGVVRRGEWGGERRGRGRSLMGGRRGRGHRAGRINGISNALLLWIR